MAPQRSCRNNSHLTSRTPEMRSLLPALLLLCPLALPAATECEALKTEVETLRARVKLLESAATATPAAPAAAQLPGTAAKPAAVQKVVVEEPYSRTGCSLGLFKGIPPGKWQKIDLWGELEKGQTPAQVEAILGPEHYDESGGGNVIWHYGRCGVASRAQALFSKGRLEDWRPPSQ